MTDVMPTDSVGKCNEIYRADDPEARCFFG